MRRSKSLLSHRALLIGFCVLLLAVASFLSENSLFRRVSLDLTFEDSERKGQTSPSEEEDGATVNAIDCGCPSTCDSVTLEEQSNGLPFTCEQRIQWLMARYNDSQSVACTTAVQGGACGIACDPTHCLTIDESSIEAPLQTTLVELMNKNTNIVSYVNNSGLNVLGQDFFGGKTCNRIRGNDTDSARILVNVSFSCYDAYKFSGMGSGNFISAFYGIRMVAHSLNNTDVVIHCSDAEETKSKLILPWVTGTFPSMTEEEALKEKLPTLDQACADYRSVPIGYRWKDMQYEMRRMAIAMVGIPNPDHPSAAWAEKYLWSGSALDSNHMQLASPQKDDLPIYPKTELDDAMLHFRCGDLVMSNHPSFGFMKFGSFSRHISPDVRSIGIATQPYDSDTQQRSEDSGATKMARCKQLVEAFVEHLTQEFPNAKVHVHNGPNETIALTFARMIMANQTVIPITSFGVFPGVSTFGTGYIRKPDYPKAPNRWLLSSPPIDQVENIKLIDEPRLMAGSVKRMWGADGSDLIEWFKNYTM